MWSSCGWTTPPNNSRSKIGSEVSCWGLSTGLESGYSPPLGFNLSLESCFLLIHFYKFIITFNKNVHLVYSSFFKQENLRIFAGRRLHPFFSSRKGGKTNQNLTDLESKCFSFEKKESDITLKPIHVFENVEVSSWLVLPEKHWIKLFIISSLVNLHWILRMTRQPLIGDIGFSLKVAVGMV